MLGICFLGVSIVANYVIQVHANGHNSLINKHLRVAAEPWSPYIIFYCNEKKMDVAVECPENENITYGGVLWDLLNLVKNSRNTTFSILRPSTPEWGVCYEKNNCTGMIGMVNRREVDFALGIFMHIPCILSVRLS